MNMKYGKELESGNRAYETPDAGLSDVDALVSTPDFKAFTDDILNVMWTGDMDSFDVEAIAKKHGVIYPHQATEPCGANCNCNLYADEFPVTCWRKAY